MRKGNVPHVNPEPCGIYGLGLATDDSIQVGRACIELRKTGDLLNGRTINLLDVIIIIIGFSTGSHSNTLLVLDAYHRRTQRRYREQRVLRLDKVPCRQLGPLLAGDVVADASELATVFERNLFVLQLV